MRRNIYITLLFFKITLFQASFLLASVEESKGFFSWVNSFKASPDNNVYAKQGEVVGQMVPIAAKATGILGIDNDQSRILSYPYEMEHNLCLKMSKVNGKIKEIKDPVGVFVQPMLINPEEAHIFAFDQGVILCQLAMRKHAEIILKEDMPTLKKDIYDEAHKAGYDEGHQKALEEFRQKKEERRRKKRKLEQD